MLKELREARGITQTELASRAKVTQAYIAKIESGEKRNPTLEILEKLAAALSIPVSELMAATAGRMWTSNVESWTVGVTPVEIHGQWTARIELWPPGLTPRSHGGIILPFAKTVSSADIALTAARKHASDWISRHG